MVTRRSLARRLRPRWALFILSTTALALALAGTAQADYTNSCGSGCVDYGGETASGHYT
jgi:hypothetical protein